MTAPRVHALILQQYEHAALHIVEYGTDQTLPDGRTYGRGSLPALLRLIDAQRVRVAIEAIEGGAQSYSIDGRALTRAALPELYRRLDELERRAVAETRGSASRVVQVVPGS